MCAEVRSHDVVWDPDAPCGSGRSLRSSFRIVANVRLRDLGLVGTRVIPGFDISGSLVHPATGYDRV